MAAIQGCHVVTSLEHLNVIVTMSADAALKGQRSNKDQNQHSNKSVADFVDDDKYNFNRDPKEKDRAPIVEICVINADKKDRIPDDFKGVVYLQEGHCKDESELGFVLQGTGTRYQLCYRRARPNTSERPLTDIRIKSLWPGVTVRSERSRSDCKQSNREDNQVRRESHTLEYQKITETYEGEKIKSASRFFLWTKYGSSPLMDIFLIRNRTKKNLIANRFLTCVEFTGEGHLADLNQGSDDPAFLCLQNDLTPYRFSSDDLDKVINLKYATPLMISLHQRSPVLARGSLKCLRDLILMKFLRFNDKKMFCHALFMISRAVCEAINICEVPRFTSAPRTNLDIDRNSLSVSESKKGSSKVLKSTCQQMIAEELLVILSQMYIKYHRVETLWDFLLASTRILDERTRNRFLKMFFHLSFDYLSTKLPGRGEEEKSPSGYRESRRIATVAYDYTADLDEATSIKILKENAGVVLDSVDLYHPRVRESVKTICHKLFPEKTSRATWPFVCNLLFLTRFAQFPVKGARNNRWSASMLQQTTSLLNLSLELLEWTLARFRRGLMKVKTLGLIFRVIYPRVIASNFLNRTWPKLFQYSNDLRNSAEKSLALVRMLMIHPRKMMFMSNEILVLMDQMILPHLEEPGVLLQKRSQILSWMSELFQKADGLFIHLFYAADIQQNLSVVQRIVKAVCKLGLDGEEFVSDSRPQDGMVSPTLDKHTRMAESTAEKAFSLINTIMNNLIKRLEKDTGRRRSENESAKLFEILKENDAANKVRADAWEVLLKHEEKGCFKYLNVVSKNADVMSNRTEDIVEWLVKNQHILPKEQLGSFLGGTRPKKEVPNEEAIRMGFFEGIVLEYGKPFEEAAGEALTDCGFRLPKESQKIERIMESLSTVYYHREPELFASPDGVFILINALLMLNTALHNPSVAATMQLKDWLRTVTDIKDIQRGFSREDFVRMFRYIRDNEYKIDFDKPQDEKSGQGGGGKPSLMNENEEVYRKMVATRRVTTQNHLNIGLKARDESANRYSPSNVDIVRALFAKIWDPLERTINTVMDHQEWRCWGNGIHILTGAVIISLLLDDLEMLNRCEELLITFWRSVKRNKCRVGIWEDKVIGEDLMRMEQKRDTNLVVELRERMHNQFDRWINHEKLKEWQKEFGPGYKIICEGRVYVGHGEVAKLSRENKRLRYTLFLFNDILLYAEKRDERNYKIHQVFPLSLCRIPQENRKNPDMKYSFKLENPIKTVTFVLKNENEKDRYIRWIGEQIRMAKIDAWKVIEQAKKKGEEKKFHSTAAFIGKFSETYRREICVQEPAQSGKHQRIRRNSADFQATNLSVKHASSSSTIYDVAKGGSKTIRLSATTPDQKTSAGNPDEDYCNLCLSQFSRGTALRLTLNARDKRCVCPECWKSYCKNCYSSRKKVCKACLKIEDIIKSIEKEAVEQKQQSSGIKQAKPKKKSRRPKSPVRAQKNEPARKELFKKSSPIVRPGHGRSKTEQPGTRKKVRSLGPEEKI